MKGRFIVLEGIDGSGTTTQLERVGAALEARGVDVHKTREPSRGPVGLFLRRALERRLSDEAGEPASLDWSALALLFAADRVDHVAREVLPALERGATVISDRYDLSSIIYQSATSPLGVDSVAWLRAINSRALRPDLTVVLGLDPEVAAARRQARGGEPELFEQDELQRRLAALYLDARALLPDEPLAFVDAALPISNVTEAVMAALDRVG